MKNAVHKLISTLDAAKERINGLAGMSTETSQTEKKRWLKKQNRTEQNIQELWDKYKHFNMYIKEHHKEKKEKRTEESFKIAEDFPKLITNTVP